MPRIDVSEVITDPDLAQDFIVHRKSGAWEAGRWVENESSITINGVVTAAGTKDINQVPEGDRTSQIVCFHSVEELFVTRAQGASPGTSDQIEWGGSKFRVYQVKPWKDFGYYKAIAISMEGD